MSANPNLSRRDFLKLSTLSGAGLVLGFRFPDAPSGPVAINMLAPTGEFVPNAYLRIAPDGTITVTVHRSEMGQGVNTAIPMIVAEELEANWDSIRIEQAPADRIYGDQVTGGSQSIQSSYGNLRNAAAAARMMLVAAAAQTWGVDPEGCTAANGVVFHPDGSQQLSYGELAEAAAALPVPERGALVLKDPVDFTIIGTRRGNFDNPDFVTGSAAFCSDLQLPGMLVAVVARPPEFGAWHSGFDSSAAEATEGVRHVVEIDTGIAVVADNTWAALQGRQALDITWPPGDHADLTSESIRQVLVDQITPNDKDNYMEVFYDIPYLAHATMEPMTCVADVRADSCEVWAPTQDRQAAKSVAQRISGLPSDAVRVHVPLIGGGFGRRLQIDYVAEAVQLSKLIGAPVKVFWTREDDMQHDFYHPLSHHQMTVNLEKTYQIKARSLNGYGIPTGAWRSVGNFPDAFINECFIDEIAAATDQDPLAAHVSRHEGTARQPVLELAAEKAGWGTPLPDGWGRGIAVHSTFGVTHVAMVVEVSVPGDGTVRVQRVVCAVDCGTVINPDIVEAQIEGGIVFGLTAALRGEITIAEGRVQQSNFHDYRLLSIGEMPEIEVHIVASEASPKGIGEMGVPPIAPAVLNAVYAATGKRIRHIPIHAEDVQA